MVQQPVDISEQAKREVCFVMFVDETTFNEFERDGTLKYPRTRRVGLWRLIVVRNLPYGDPRRTGKVRERGGAHSCIFLHRYLHGNLNQYLHRLWHRYLLSFALLSDAAWSAQYGLSLHPCRYCLW